jgi:hypothetical protein
VSARVSTAAAVAFVGGLALFLVAPALLQLQADSFRDLYLGRWIVGHGIPHHEVFAIANRGREWIDQQWLADVFGYEIWRVGGYQGLAIVNALAFACAYAVLAGLMRRRGAPTPVAISFASFAMVSVFSLVFIRAQSFALPLFPILLWLCYADAAGDRIRAHTLAVVPLLVLWANVHGSVLLGAAFASGCLMYRAVRLCRAGRRRVAAAYLALATAAALTVFATPYGIGVLHYYREFVGNGAVGAADLEWDPPMFPALSFFQFVIPLGVAGVAVLLALLRKRRWPPWLDLWAVGLTAVGAAMAMRNNVWLGMASALVVAQTAQSWIPTQPLTRGFVRVLGACAVVLAAIGLGRLATRNSVQYERLAPGPELTVTAAYAAGHRCATVLADITSVSALLWRYPWMAERVAYDGRIESYTPTALMSWVRYQSGDLPHARELLQSYTMLVGSARSPALLARLERLPRVRVLARDSRGIVVLNADAIDARCRR